MGVSERGKMEVKEKRGRLCRKKVEGKMGKKKNEEKEKEMRGRVKRGKEKKGSMIVWDGREVVEGGGKNDCWGFVGVCVGGCLIDGGG